MMVKMYIAYSMLLIELKNGCYSRWLVQFFIAISYIRHWIQNKFNSSVLCREVVLFSEVYMANTFIHDTIIKSTCIQSGQNYCTATGHLTRSCDQ